MGAAATTAGEAVKSTLPLLTKKGRLEAELVNWARLGEAKPRQRPRPPPHSARARPPQATCGASNSLLTMKELT